MRLRDWILAAGAAEGDAAEHDASGQ